MAGLKNLIMLLDSGYDGVRLSGNTSWLEKEDWNSFVEYKEQTDDVIGNYRMIALCTYSLDRHNTAEIIDLVVKPSIRFDQKRRKMGADRKLQTQEGGRSSYSSHKKLGTYL